MSLLGDVLRKTEPQRRRIAPEIATGAAAQRRLEPTAEKPDATQSPWPRGRDDVFSSIDQLAQLAIGNAPERAAGGDAQTLTAGAAAGGAAALTIGQRALMLRYFALGAVSGIALVAVTAYLWLQIHQSSSDIAPGLALQPVLDAPTSHADVTPAPVPQQPVSTAVPPGQSPQTMIAPALRPASAASEAAGGVQQGSAKNDRSPPVQPSSTQTLSARLVAEPTPDPADTRPPVRVGASPVRVNPGVMAAYQAFQGGDLAAARSAYEQVLKAEPRNSDALHGLAAIALREGRQDSAENYYLRALDADPKDNLAQAGLLDLKGHGDTEHPESRLKSLLASQPDSPFLNFSLGNYYARHGRWAEAQQAYFRAWVRDSANPDYLFNLAVSLDQLRQTGLALQYYEKALTAAGARAGTFDREQVATRIDELRR